MRLKKETTTDILVMTFRNLNNKEQNTILKLFKDNKEGIFHKKLTEQEMMTILKFVELFVGYMGVFIQIMDIIKEVIK